MKHDVERKKLGQEAKNGSAGGKAGAGQPHGWIASQLAPYSSVLAAAALLGLGELIFLAAASNYLSMRSLGVGVLFAAYSAISGGLIAAVLAWGAVKRWSNGAAPVQECMKTGVVLGAYSAAAVCAFALVFILAGILPGGLAQDAHAKNRWQAILECVMIFAGIISFYLAAGALSGLVAKLFIRARAQREKKQAQTGGSLRSAG